MRQTVRDRIQELINIPDKKKQTHANKTIVVKEIEDYKPVGDNPEWFKTKLSRAKTLPAALTLLNEDMGDQAYELWLEQVIIKILTAPQVSEADVPKKKEEPTHA